MPGPGMAPLRSHREIGIQARSPPPPILPGSLAGPPDFAPGPTQSFGQQMHPGNGSSFAPPAPFNGYDMSLVAESLSRQHNSSGGLQEQGQASAQQSAPVANGGEYQQEDTAGQSPKRGPLSAPSLEQPGGTAPRMSANRPPPLRTGGPPHPGRITMPIYTQFTANPLSPLQTRNMPPMTPSVTSVAHLLHLCVDVSPFHRCLASPSTPTQ